MDPVKHRRMRTAHTKYHHDCACGRRLWGNGYRSHMRNCETALAQTGWPLDNAMQVALYMEYRLSGIATAVERKLGQFHLARRRAGDKSPLSWQDFKELLWRYAAEAYDDIQKKDRAS